MATLAPALPPAEAADETAPPIERDERSRSKAVVASQWRLMWWRFRRHRLAVAATIVIFVFYVAALFVEMVAPMDPTKVSTTYRYVPPQPITFFDQNGHFTLRPGVNGLKGVRNPETLRFTYAVDKSQWTPIHFFVHGDPYKFWGVVPMDIHLIGVGQTQTATGATTGVVPPPDVSAPGAAGGGTGAGSSGGFTGIGSIGGFGGSSGSTTSTGTTSTGATNEAPVATVAPVPPSQPASA